MNYDYHNDICQSSGEKGAGDPKMFQLRPALPPRKLKSKFFDKIIIVSSDYQWHER